MKKILLPFVCATIVLFAACSKDKKDPTPTPVPSPVSNVEITQVDDTIHQMLGATAYYDLLIKQVSGDNEQITLSSTGFPSKINVSYLPDTGLATFRTRMEVDVDEFASTGYFKGQLVAKNKSGATKTKDVVIHTFDDCMHYVYGSWVRMITYSDGTTYGPINVYFTVNGPYYTSDGFGLNTYTFDCATGTVVLSNSEFDRYTGSEIYGTGTVSDSKITINGSFRKSSSGSFEPIKIEYTPR